MKRLVAAAALAACGPTAPGASCVDQLGPGDLVLTEVFAASGDAGGDAGREWFEIYNASDRPLELGGLTLVHSRADGSSAKTHAMTNITIAPGQYFTLGNTSQALVLPYVDYGYASDLGSLSNSTAGKLALRCGDAEIDSADYEAIAAGHSRELSSAQPPDYTFNDDGAHWCQGNDTEFASGNFGTPGAESDCMPLVFGQCSDAGAMRPVVSPGPGDLVITELMPSPVKTIDTNGEWFEAKAMRAIDLNGLGLDRASDAQPPDLIDAPACLGVAPGELVLFAHSVDPAVNGGLPDGSVRGTFKFAMVTGPGDVRILSGSTVIDAVTWPTSPNGKSIQLDPMFTDATSNDQASNFCAGTLPYGAGDLGTPGHDNGACVLLPPAGMCTDGAMNRPIVKPTMGHLVISEYLANPAGSTDAQREWFEIANTGAGAFDLNGLGLASKSSATHVVQSATCLSIAPGGFGLFARSSDPSVNAMLPAVDATFSFALVDTSGGIQVLDGATVLDAVTWPSVKSGVAAQRDPASAVFCPASETYGDTTNKGTPKAANAPCP